MSRNGAAGGPCAAGCGMQCCVQALIGPPQVVAAVVVTQGHAIMPVLALEPVLDLAYAKGLRASGDLPADIMATVGVYNDIPAGSEDQWTGAVAAAWRDYCARKEAARG